MPNQPLATTLILALLLLPPAGGGDAAEARPEAEPEGALTRFEDWTLDCRATCRLETSVEGAAGAEVLRLSIDAAFPDVLVIRTGLPLYLPDPVLLAVAGAEPGPIPWHTCGAAGCEARVTLAPGLRAALRREREAAVSFRLLDGERVRLPVSLMGFTAGERALGGAGGG